jgi:hypothetical protein
MPDVRELADLYADAVMGALSRPDIHRLPDHPTLDFVAAQMRAWADKNGMSEAELQESGALRPDGLESLITRYYGEVLELLNPKIRAFCEDRVRFRGIPTNSIEGFISKSPDDVYVVVVTTGFMSLINKIVKIDLAISDPGYVIHCNRLPLNELNRGVLSAYKREIVYNFQSNRTQGPLIVLDEKLREGYAGLIQFQELFIICHELGHLFSDFLLNGLLIKGMNSSYGSAQHRSEYLADILGFALLRRYQLYGRLPDPAFKQLDEQLRLSAICQFFEIIGLVAPEASETHPAPHDRACNLIDVFYGEHFAVLYDGWRRGPIRDLDWDRAWAQGTATKSYAGYAEALMSGDEALSDQLIQGASGRNS